MREAGDVCFADVFKDGTGVCEYVRYEDMKYALKKLDDTKFKSHEVCIQTIPYTPFFLYSQRCAPLASRAFLMVPKASR